MSASSSRTEKDFDHQLPSVSSLKPLLVAGSGPDSMIACNGKSVGSPKFSCCLR